MYLTIGAVFIEPPQDECSEVLALGNTASVALGQREKALSDIIPVQTVTNRKLGAKIKCNSYQSPQPRKILLELLCLVTV